MRKKKEQGFELSIAAIIVGLGAFWVVIQFLLIPSLNRLESEVLQVFVSSGSTVIVGFLTVVYSHRKRWQYDVKAKEREKRLRLYSTIVPAVLRRESVDAETWNRALVELPGSVVVPLFEFRNSKARPAPGPVIEAIRADLGVDDIEFEPSDFEAQTAED